MASISSLYADIDQKNYKPVYLICGGAELLISEVVDYLIAEFQKDSLSSINVRQLDAEEVEPDDVIEEACTPPFFSDRRLLIVKNVDKWSQAAQKKLLPVLKNPPSFTVLVLIGESPAKLQTISTLLRKKNGLISGEAPRDRDLIGWIRKRAQAKGKNISGPAAAHLLELVGKDLRELSNALDKLIAYTDKTRNIEVKDVLDALDDIRTRSIFELTDAFGNRMLVTAIKSVRRLLETGESPLRIISMLDRQLRNIWQARVATQQGKSISDLAEIFSTPQWIAKKFATQSKNYTINEIKRAFELLYEADKLIKTTMVPSEDILELLIIKICSKQDMATTANNAGFLAAEE
ncbi:MAG TPA: DNA polymerase III subunit delta [Deltaproteobacteria bacterium]|nr:DNA polymerase III subunit delta [Deltaproteobacteria bacterium]